jgi:hypothetical protein
MTRGFALFLLMSVGELKEMNPVLLKPSSNKGEVEVNLNQYTTPALEESGRLAPLSNRFTRFEYA